MKRIWMTLAASAALMSQASAANIGVSMASFEDNFLTVVREGIQTAAAGKEGMQVQFEDATSDIGKQLNQIQNFIAQGVDGIIVNTVDADATPQMTKLAAEAGIPLVYVNRQPADLDTLPEKAAFVGSDERDSGTLQMNEACKLMGGKGDIVVMMGELSNQSARQRTQDIEDVIAKEPCTGIKILEKQTANWSRTQATDLMTNWISGGLKPAAVLANNDEMAIGAIQALKAAGASDVIVAGIDATQDGLAAMKSGDLKITVFQNAKGQGAGAVDTIEKLIKGEKAEKVINVPFELVTPETMAKYEAKN